MTYGFPEVLEGRSERERALLLAAKAKHDETNHMCDPKYVFVCREFQRAITTVGVGGRS